MMKTYTATPSDIQHEWYLVDAQGQTLGRLASRIAHVLRGKHKTMYTPHMDTGDYVVVVNVEKIKLTGKKESDKIYYHHTGYPGGIKSASVSDWRARFPERILEHAVKGMMPKGPLGRSMMGKLKLFKGPEHRHQAQSPQSLLSLFSKNRSF